MRLRILRDDGPEALYALDPAYPDDLGVTTQQAAMEAPIDSLSESIEALLDFGGAGSGSNNWAVSGDLTASGRAIVANEMHLRLSAPNVFYRARLMIEEQPSLDVSGVTLPGTPVVVTGSNGFVAWAFTNSYGDWSDAVIVRSGSTYEFILI